jgi:Fe2+ transport system protein FeoA
MPKSKAEYVPLGLIQPGAHFVIRVLQASQEINSRLMLLGLAVGTAAQVIQNTHNGPMLIRARNTLVAVGHEEAKRILVEVSP